MTDTDVMPSEYDEGFLKKDPHTMLRSVLSEMFKKGISPSLLTFTAFIFSYFRVGAYDECVTIFDYMKKRLDLYYDAHTISIMTKVYNRLGQNDKSEALSRLNSSEIMEGDLSTVGAQFDLMLSAGRFEELEDTFKEMDDHRDLGSRNMTYALRMYIKE
jgi:pentatricopeptide repeat protein